MAASATPDFVIGPDAADWDAARGAFNLAADQRPEAIALPATVDEVVAAIELARASGLRVAPQRTGHAAVAIESLDGVLLLRTDRLRGAEIDSGARTARVAGGTLWGEVADLATPHGLLPLAGSSRGVGVVGYHLGGGLSYASRKHGLAASAVRAVELVTPAGERVRATADSEPELFWALRGGGGSFGVVTALEFGLFEAPAIYAGNLLFPAERAREVLHAWREATLTAPDELTMSARVLQIPDIDGPPPPLRGRAFAVVDVVFLGEERDGAELIAPLRALGPEIDGVATADPGVLGTVHMDPEDPAPALTDHMLTGPLPSEAIDAFVDVTGPAAGSTLVSAELRQNGGALARPAPGGGALDSLPCDYHAFGVGMLMGPEAAAKLRADLDRVLAALEPYAAGRYFNYAEFPLPAAELFGGEVFERLRKVKAHWDPDDLIVAGHPIG